MNSLLRRPRRSHLLAAFWLTAIAVGVLALIPATFPMPSTGWDKANHALAFAVLGLLGCACWPHAAARVLIALAAYGGAIEIAQTFTETRVGEWTDWFADIAGFCIALAVRWRYAMRAERLP